MRVPFLDLKEQYRSIQTEVEAAIRSVFDESMYILGSHVETFEREFAAYCGVGHCVGVASGLDALTLTLKALEIGEGHEVLVPANSFVATALAVTQAGATPVLVDCRENSFNIDPDLIEARITSATRAIMPVHLYGRLADMDAIVAIGKRHGLHVIEDAAQAHGAERGARRAGNFGIAGCFSFYPGKNLGAYGDGGAVVTADADLAERLRALRNYGSTVKYRHDMLGTNSRLDSIQAAVLSVKLKHLDAWNGLRRKKAQMYRETLEGAGVELPDHGEGTDHVWHLYVVRSRQRDELQERLRQKGIITQIHYPIPIHLQPCYLGQLGSAGTYPVAETLSREVLSLPIFPELTKEQIRVVADAVQG